MMGGASAQAEAPPQEARVPDVMTDRLSAPSLDQGRHTGHMPARIRRQREGLVTGHTHRVPALREICIGSWWLQLSPAATPVAVHAPGVDSYQGSQNQLAYHPPARGQGI